jgi:hypothetical protein
MSPPALAFGFSTTFAGVRTYSKLLRFCDRFCADQGVSLEKSNTELREMGKDTPFSLNVHTP